MNHFTMLYGEVEKCAVKEKGVTMQDIMALPEPLSQTLIKLIRKRRMSLDDLATELELAPAQMSKLCDVLIHKGYLKVSTNRRESEPVYRLLLAPKPKSPLPTSIWQTLDDL